MTPDANFVCSNFICDSLYYLQAETAAVLNAAAIVICAVIGLWLDELINDIALHNNSQWSWYGANRGDMKHVR